jgi:UDP-glucose 4-epimerase
MKQILVTGGFGFIGGHLIERLLDDPNNHVHVVDNLSSCPIPYPLLIDELEHPPNLTYETISIWEFFHISSKNLCVYDEIYHLASPVGPAGVLQHAGQMIGNVVDDIYLLINLALREDAKLVDVSTSEVYGGGAGGLCAEGLDKIISADTTVRLEYAIAKLAAETAIINTCKVNPLRASIVRPFNVAGPRQSGVGGFVLPRFIDQAMRGEPLTVFGDGNQVRAFTHVADIVDGLIRVMESGQSGEAYNLGNPINKTSINEMANRVNDITGNQAGVTYVDPKDIFGDLYAEGAEKYPDARKAISELGWSPKYGIIATITDALRYQKSCNTLTAAKTS